MSTSRARVVVYFPEDVLERVDALAAVSHRSRSQTIMLTVDWALAARGEAWESPPAQAPVSAPRAANATTGRCPMVVPRGVRCKACGKTH